MSQSQKLPVQAPSEVMSQVRDLIQSIQESEPLKLELTAEEFNVLGGFIDSQMLPDGGYPKDAHYRVESRWMEYAPDAGSRLYERRYYYDTAQVCIYSLGYQGGWQVVRCW